MNADQISVYPRSSVAHLIGNFRDTGQFFLIVSMYLSINVLITKAISNFPGYGTRKFLLAGGSLPAYIATLKLNPPAS